MGQIPRSAERTFSSCKYFQYFYLNICYLSCRYNTPNTSDNHNDNNCNDNKNKSVFYLVSAIRFFTLQGLLVFHVHCPDPSGLLTLRPRTLQSTKTPIHAVYVLQMNFSERSHVTGVLCLRPMHGRHACCTHYTGKL